MGLKGLLPEIASHERFRFACAAFGFMCVASAALVARATADALFLSHFGAEWLPYMYIGSAVLLILVSSLYGSFAGRIAVARLTASTILILIAATLGLRFALLGTSPLIRVASYFLADVLVNLPMVLFFSFLAYVFDMREGKRLFGLVGSAGTAACIAVGLVVRPLAKQFGTENLLFLVAALLLGFVAMVAVFAHREARRFQTPAARGGSGSRGTRFGYYADLLKTPQIRNLALLMVVTTLALTFVDFQFKTAARAAYQGPALAGFFGGFYAIANIAALILQLFFVHRILQHAGLLAALAMLPVGVLLSSVGTALFGSFGWIVAAKASEPVFNFSINSAATQMLYLGVRKQSRGQARAFVDGVAKPVAMAIAGGLLIAGVTGSLSGSVLALVVAVIAGGWVVLCWANYRAYMAGLVDSVGARTADFQSMARVSDRALEGHIRNTILTAGDDEVPYVAGLLDEFSNIDATPEFRQLLARDSPPVKVLALEYLTLHPDRSDLSAVLANIDHPDANVRSAAVNAAAAIGKEDALPALEGRLDDPVSAVRAAAAVQLINVGDIDAFLAAGAVLKGMLGQPDPSQRAAATGALARIKTGGVARLLGSLLADPDPDVQLAALAAFRNRPTPTLIPEIVALLGTPLVGESAEDALVLLGANVLPHLRRRVTAATLAGGDSQAEAEVARLAARIAHPDGIPIVVDCLSRARGDFRRAVVESLCLIVAGQESPRAHYPILEAALEFDLAGAFQRQGQLQSLRGVTGVEVLMAALEDEFKFALRNIFRLLDTLIPTLDMNVLGFALQGPEGEARAQALELLDNVLDPKLKPRVFGLFERRVVQAIPLVASEMLSPETASEWVTIGVLYASMRGGFALSEATLLRLLEHGDPMVRETALQALSERESPSLEAAVATALEDASPQVRRLAQSRGTGEGRKESNVMITVQKVLFLRNVPLFAGMSSREIGQIANIAEDIVYEAGQPVIREGELGDSLFVIVDGTVRVHRGETTFTTLKQNDYLGEMSLFDGEPRSASATAISDCVVLRIGQAEFNNIMARHFGAVLSVVRVLTQRVRKKEIEAAEATKALAAMVQTRGAQKS